MPIENMLADRLLILIPLWLSLSIHEWAHAWTAFKLGDDTAARLGRMTLNPLAHIDPVGTLLLPLLGVPFGWATPVPVQPHRFHRNVNMRTGMMITAAAGPISNLCIAVVSIVAYALLIRFYPQLLAGNSPADQILRMLIALNVILAVFNMLPIPPLDGSRIADWLMPRKLRPTWEQFAQYWPFALAAVIVLPMVWGISLFAWPMSLAWKLKELLVRLLGG